MKKNYEIAQIEVIELSSDILTDTESGGKCNSNVCGDDND